MGGLIGGLSRLDSGGGGCGSKPCTPGAHRNRWYMGVHPPQNGGIGYDGRLSRSWEAPPIGL